MCFLYFCLSSPMHSDNVDPMNVIRCQLPHRVHVGSVPSSFPRIQHGPNFGIVDRWHRTASEDRKVASYLLGLIWLGCSTSALESRHFGRAPTTSGLPLSTDIIRPAQLVRLVAQPNSCTAANLLSSR